jgi:predicted HAD superfamily Cof-like phosphohydrolase
MHKPQAQVRNWHQLMGDDFPRPGEQPVDTSVNTKLRLDLLLEELQELGAAVGHRLVNGEWIPLSHQHPEYRIDSVEAIDALADLAFVLYGACDTWGIDLEPYFDEVYRSNLTKVGGAVREDGKRLKPDTYEPPIIALIGGRSKAA